MSPGGAFRNPAGGRVDRSRVLPFAFDGRRYEGLAGDTLASALLANGVRLVGRSFKYHRPRGVMTAGSEEPNALVGVGTGAAATPNLRATEVELHAGLEARSQNRWPSLALDLGAVNDLLSKLFVAGFYYKTFMHPRSFWMRVYEPLIRRAAGLGRAPAGPDPETYDKAHARCDVLVVGAGPAGLMAALSAGRAGARVILADERPEPGGSLLERSDRLDDRPGADWAAAAAAELRALPEVRVLPRTTVAGYYDGNYLTAVERRTDHLPPAERGARSRQRLWKVRASRVVLATGAHERPLVFAGNDRPGVMLASAARAYANRFGVRPGSRAVLFTNNDSAYAAARDLAGAGVEVAAIVDLRPDAAAGGGRAMGLRVIPGSAVVATRGARGGLAGVEVMALTPDGAGVAGGAPESIACDLLGMSGGWNPAVHLFSQAQGQLRFDDARACFVPGGWTWALHPAGAANGRFDLAGCLAEGAEAGAAAARAAGFGGAAAARTPATDASAASEASPMRPLWVVPGRRPPHRGGWAKHFVDFQNDVTAADLRLAHREGYRHVEHAKRYTTAGMGTDQGKTSNVNALAILAGARGEPIPAVGTTTFRPPYAPVTFGALAGRDVGALADPVRVTPFHAWHEARGAAFEDVGQWKRPRYFPRPGEGMAEAVNRECRAVRGAAGLLDASTLGKIEVRGPDATAFLDLAYTGAWGRLAVGRCRYAVLCREDGMVLDDGIGARLGPDRWLFTTSTGNAAGVLDHLEDLRQTEFPHLKVHLTSVTEHWATAQLAGPRAREILAAVAPDLPLGRDAFPFMAHREATVAGIPARVFRVSFTGELSFEVVAPAHRARAVWDALLAAGEAHGLEPFGTEAMHVLRAEKGYVIVGQETDGTVTPFDLGLGWAVGRNKPDFIGRRSLARPDATRPDRRQLVGLLTDDPGFVLPEGAPLTAPGAAAATPPPVPMVGHVTSSYWSPTLGRSIALALVEGGAARHGEAVEAPLPGRTLPCRIASPVFVDPEGARAHG